MHEPLAQRLAQRLQQHQANGLMRQRKVRDSDQGVLDFTRNDYLALSQHPTLIAALQQASASTGCSAKGSALAQGHQSVHQQLEQTLADWLGYPRALLFTSGYLANLAVISALIQREDFIAIDKQAHASVFDGVQLTQASWQRYADNDHARLQHLLTHTQAPINWIISSSVFSMQGHCADLPALCEIAQAQQATLIIDDIHGTGILGEQGQGIVSHAQLSPAQAPLVIGSLTKALGTLGAFVVGSDALIESILQFARPYMFSTTLPPAYAHASLQAIDVAKQAKGARAHLRQLADYFQAQTRARGFKCLSSSTPIQAIVFEQSETALYLAQRLRQENILVSAIRAPSVPKRSPRLRITFNAAHQLADLDRLLDVLQDAYSEYNLSADSRLCL